MKDLVGKDLRKQKWGPPRLETRVKRLEVSAVTIAVVVVIALIAALFYAHSQDHVLLEHKLDREMRLFKLTQEFKK